MKEPNNSESFRREAEARHVLKLPDDKRQEYYRGVLRERKQAGLDYLVSEVKRQTEIEAKNLLGKPDKEREDYYRNVLGTRGRESVDTLITEVKRQRKLMRQKETALEI